MLSCELLPAAQGDCLWIEYGDPVRRVLVDGGPYNTYRHLHDKIRSLPQDERHFELMIVTHVDADHIEGILRLLQESSLGVSFDDVWFNGATQLNAEFGAPDQLDEREGEYLQALLLTSPDQHWNNAFGGKPIYVPEHGELPTAKLDGDATLTVLSPTTTQLRALLQRWVTVIAGEKYSTGDTAQALKALTAKKRLKALQAADMLGGDSVEADDPPGSDRAVANGSSIAVIFEHDGHRLLLTGDAYASVLTASLKRVDNGRPVELALFKLPHHGSIRNITDDMIRAVTCQQFAISTNGSYFKHPNIRAIDTLLTALPPGCHPRLWFNYLSKQAEWWVNHERQEGQHYTAEHPPAGQQGIKVSFP
jgi:beta-lactamase superfamily II metal-dependent hydrolase